MSLSTTHGIMVVFTLVCMSLMFVMSCVYVRHDYYLKIKRPKPAWLNFFPSLEKMHRWILRLFYIVLIALTLLVINGLILAHDRWADNWLRQPKLIVALITWLYFFLMFVVRRWKGLRGTTFFVWIIIGSVMMALSMYGAYAWV